MFAGIIAGIAWAVETIILGIALAMNPFCSTEQAVLLAPFASTFLHDAFRLFGRVYIMESKETCPKLLKR